MVSVNDEPKGDTFIGEILPRKDGCMQWIDDNGMMHFVAGMCGIQYCLDDLVEGYAKMDHGMPQGQFDYITRLMEVALRYRMEYDKNK